MPLTRLQRAWAVISLLVLAAFLAWYFLEWAGYSASDNNATRLVLEFYNTTIPTDCPVDTYSRLYQKLCAGGKSNLLIVHGLYVRFGRSIQAAFYIGTFLPLILFIIAGFVLLRKRCEHRDVAPNQPTSSNN
jgi:hypothetical protein